MFRIAHFLEHPGRADPAVGGNFATVDFHLDIGVDHRQVEPGGEAPLDPLGGGPAGQQEQLLVGDFQAGFLAGLADRGAAGGTFAIPLGGVIGRVHAATGEDPLAAHVSQRGIALNQQHLRARGGIPQQDHGGGGMRGGGTLTHFQHAGHPQGKKRLMVSTTQAGRSLPSTSMVMRTTTCTPPFISSALMISPRPRTWLSTGTGAGKRTLSQP